VLVFSGLLFCNWHAQAAWSEDDFSGAAIASNKWSVVVTVLR